MTPAEHRAQAEAMALVFGAPKLATLNNGDYITLALLHALLAVPFVDPDEIISVDTSDEPRTPDRCGSYWLKCARCGDQFVFSHLCREHMLCGRCHPTIKDPEEEHGV